jgi:hypothetical protein
VVAPTFAEWLLHSKILCDTGVVHNQDFGVIPKDACSGRPTASAGSGEAASRGIDYYRLPEPVFLLFHRHDLSVSSITERIESRVKIVLRFFAAVMILGGLFFWFQRVNDQRTKATAQANERLLQLQQSSEKLQHKLDCQHPEKRAQMTRDEINKWCPVRSQ